MTYSDMGDRRYSTI